MSVRDNLSRYEQRLNSSQQAPRPLRNAPLAIPDDTRSIASTQVTFRNKDNEPLFRVSRETVLLASAMMSKDHSTRTKPARLEDDLMPYALSSKARKDGDDARETQVPPSRQQNRQHSDTKQRDTKPRDSGPALVVPIRPKQMDTIEEETRSLRYRLDELERKSTSAKHEESRRESHKREKYKDEYHTKHEERTKYEESASQRHAYYKEEESASPRHAYYKDEERASKYKEDERSSQRNAKYKDDERASYRRDDYEDCPVPYQSATDDPEPRSRRRHRSNRYDRLHKLKCYNLHTELTRLKAIGYPVELPEDSNNLSLLETAYEQWTIIRVTRDRVQYIQTMIRGGGALIYVVMRLFGAWWIDGWIVSLSNEIQDPSIEPALERMYVRHFDYTEPNPNYVLWMMIAKTVIMTIVANISGNGFNNQYGKQASLKEVPKNGLTRVVDTQTPYGREEAQQPPSFGEGMLPTIMRTATQFMPTILSSLGGGGGLASMISGLAGAFSPRPQAPAPIRVNPGLQPFVQPSI